jgi:cell volume regulation protein A
MTIDKVLVGGSLLLFISVIFSKASVKIGVPTLIIFIAIGMLTGPSGLGLIHLNDLGVAQLLGSISLTLILFSGGLDTEISHVKPIFKNGLSLSTIGVLITAVAAGLFTYVITDFSLLEGLLIGSIVSSTDAAAVFSILKSKNLRLKNNLAPTLELESGSNDAMAYLLMVFFTSIIKNPDKVNFWSIIPFFFEEMIIGSIIGVFIGRSMLFIINRVRLNYDALYSALTLSMTLFAYSAANLLHGNGFLAVYISGIIVGNKNFMYKKEILRFYDSISWLMQIVMFIALGLLVVPSKLLSIAPVGFALAIALMFVARPLGVFISLLFSKSDTSQKIFVSWVGLKGAVPIVLSIYPIIHGVDKSDTMFHIVFFVVITSVLLQGSTLYKLAQKLNLEDTSPVAKKSKIIELSDEVKSDMIEVVIPENSIIASKKIFELGLPINVLIVLINRGNKYITPRGDTVVEVGDKLMVMIDDKDDLKKLYEIIAPKELS